MLGLFSLFRKRTRTTSRSEPETPNEDASEFFDWSDGLEDADDSDLYFSPERGNVVFASAYDNWAFDLGTFAKIYSQKLGCRENVSENLILLTGKMASIPFSDRFCGRRSGATSTST